MGFGYYRTITIDKTKVPNTDQSNFPVLISGTYSYLKTVGNGGLVQNASGYDIGFYSDAALTTKLKWEIEKYVASTGEVIYWVKVPSVSTSVDTVIYIAYGDAGVSADQSDAANVWDSDFKAVYHLGDGSTKSGVDSTSNARNLTFTGTVAVTGKVSGAVNFTNSGDIGEMASELSLSGGVYTISGWGQGSNSTNFRTLLRGTDSGGTGDHPLIVEAGTNLLGWYGNRSGGSMKSSGYNWNAIAGGWHHFVARTSGGNTLYYIDGVYVGMATGVSTDPNVKYVGNYQSGGQPWGYLDELKVSTVSRSVDWIVTEYNNQNSPSTFYSVGSEIASLPPVNNTMMLLF